MTLLKKARMQRGGDRRGRRTRRPPGQCRWVRAGTVKRPPRETALALHARDESFTCRFDKAASTNDYWVMKSMAVDGNGIAPLPDYFTRPEVATGMLSPVLPAWSATPAPVYCAYQKQRYMAKKLRAFIDLAIGSFAKIDSLQYYIVDRRAHERSAALFPDQTVLAPSEVP
jgi:DNA-binding transcriptional LysR family regulator